MGSEFVRPRRSETKVKGSDLASTSTDQLQTECGADEAQPTGYHEGVVFYTFILAQVHFEDVLFYFFSRWPPIGLCLEGDDQARLPPILFFIYLLSKECHRFFCSPLDLFFSKVLRDVWIERLEYQNSHSLIIKLNIYIIYNVFI